MKVIHAGPNYHAALYEHDNLKTTVKKVFRVVEELRKWLPVSAVAGCGHSAATLVGALAGAYDLDPIMVRKEGETGVVKHGLQVSGRLGNFNYVIVDDTVASGSTVRRIVSQIDEAVEKMNKYADDHNSLEERLTKPVCLGVVTVNGGSSTAGLGAKYDFQTLPVMSVNHPYFERKILNSFCRRVYENRGLKQEREKLAAKFDEGVAQARAAVTRSYAVAVQRKTLLPKIDIDADMEAFSKKFDEVVSFTRSDERSLDPSK